jgi:hypothetical protein
MLFKVESFSDSYVCCIMQSEGIIKAYFYIPDTSLEFKKNAESHLRGYFFLELILIKLSYFMTPLWSV